jgi:hypothetical protein
MPIIRVVKDPNNPFVQINKACLQDRRLSWKAKGLLAYLLGNKDSWKVYVSELAKKSTDRLESTSAGVRELIKHGYMTRKRIRNKGRFLGWEYTIYEAKITEMGFPAFGSPDFGKPASNNNKKK